MIVKILTKIGGGKNLGQLEYSRCFLSEMTSFCHSDVEK